MDSDLDIVGRLGSSVAEERREALETLDNLGPKRALSVLLSALGDDLWRIRKTAIEALEVYPDSSAVINAIVPLLGEGSDTPHRNAAIELLTHMGAKAMPSLLSAISDSDPHMRKLVADILGQVRDPLAERALIQALNDTDENVRMAAAEALGNYSGKTSHEALLQLLNGPDLTLKFCAMESLAQMGREIPIDQIKVLVGQKILRRAVFDVLGSSSSGEAVRILIGGLGDSSPSSRNAAIRSLGKIYARDLFARNLIKDELKKAARDKNILDAHLQALNESNIDLQKGALRLLGLLLNPASVPNIIDAARNTELEADAMEALRLIAERHAEAILKNMPPHGDSLHDLLSSFIKSVTYTGAPAKEEPITPTPTQMTDAQFETFRNYLHDFCGIHFKDEMKFILEKRLLRRMEALRISGFEQYINVVMNTAAGKQEIWEAINILTTNETYFFREKFQLQAFSEEILPMLRKEKERTGMRRLRVWSAGCSSGEEPYTLAMLIDESGLFEGWDIHIIGGDISERVLEQARAGIYHAGSFRATTREYIDKYFTRVDNESWQISDRLKRWVEFRHINLFDKHEVGSIGPFDVVFCRNVIIYFDLSSKRQVMETLHESLVPGGHLLLGHSESLVNISVRFDLVHLKNDMVYRKPPLVGGFAR